MSELEPTVSERSAHADIEAAENEIREFIRDVPLEHPRFQAFADYADVKYSESDSQRVPGTSFLQTELSLIMETIRQRKNGVKGYKKEFQDIEKLGNELARSINRKKSQNEAPLDFSTNLRAIKNAEIDKRA